MRLQILGWLNSTLDRQATRPIDPEDADIEPIGVTMGTLDAIGMKMLFESSHTGVDIT